MPRTFLIWSKMRWRSALSLGSRNTKAPSLVRSSTTFFTAAVTSSSVNSLVGPVAAGAAAGAAVVLSLVGAVAVAGVVAGVLVEGWSAALRGAATPKHSAAEIAVARAIETRPRSELSYIIGLNFLVIPGADAPLRCQGTRHRDRPRSLYIAGPKTAVGWGGFSAN